jgi:4-diphosphocytidyl-2-C-methyl-D-erythritol kinase
MEEYVQRLGRASNDFESVVLETRPDLVEIRDELRERGAALARMSGSGPTVFGIFTDFPVDKEKVRMRRGSWRIYAVAPITLHWQVTE